MEMVTIFTWLRNGTRNSQPQRQYAIASTILRGDPALTEGVHTHLIEIPANTLAKDIPKVVNLAMLIQNLD